MRRRDGNSSALLAVVVVATAAATAGCATRPEDQNVVYVQGSADAGVWTGPPVPTAVAPAGPTCSAGAVADIQRGGVRQGRTLKIRVDTRPRQNDLHPTCRAGQDSVEAAVRYRVPAGVPAVFATTTSGATEFDTVLYVRSNCSIDARDITCNYHDNTAAPRSAVYVTDIVPDEVLYFIIDGADGQRGQAELTIVEVGVGGPGEPCRDAPNDTPAGLRHPARCDLPRRCSPGAAADGTGLCLDVVPTGSACDPDERTNLCTDGAQCAVDPMDRTSAVCAVPGTAPGADCRRDAPRCGDGLTCATARTADERDTCVRLLPVGADCDPDGRANACAAPQQCRTLDRDAGTTRCM